MNKDYKILKHIDDIESSHLEPIQLIDGLYRNPKEIIRTIEFYTNDKYLSGNQDALGREKPFFQICNFRVTVAKTATDIDVKDIRYEPDSLDDSDAAMLINHELYKYLKESNFSETLNDMGKTRPKYGGLLIKKYDDGEGMEIEVVDWKNVSFNPSNISDGIIIETHYMQPSELAEKADVWENVKEVLKAHAKANKNKPASIEVKEVTGEFDETFDPEIEDIDANEIKFKSMCFYIAIVNKKKFFLYKEDLKEDEDKYKYLAWEKIGEGLGRGVVEDGFEAQWATNDTMLSIKNAMELSGKVILATDSQKVSGNAITGVDNGHIFQLEAGRSITSLNLQASALPQFQNVIELWRQQYDNSVSVHDANTGEAPTAGTPYSQTALLNQVANSPFEYQREVWGIFLNEVLNDWIFPYLIKKIKKPHYLVSEFSRDELERIDKVIRAKNMKQMVKDSLLAGTVPSEDSMNEMGQNITDALGALKNKRQGKILEGFLDIKGRITANITGELKNKSAVLQSLDSVLKTIVSTFNPNTGKYAALEDPILSKVFGTIVEMSGIPLSFGQLKPSNSSPTPQPDMSAIAPQSSTLPTNTPQMA